MIISVHLLLFLAFVSGFGFCAAIAAGLGFWYMQQKSSESQALALYLGEALGELKAIKNHDVVDLKGRQQILFGLLGSVEKHLFLERRDGKLTRVIGDTSDLSIFPEMTPTLAAEIACLLAKAAGKVVAACAGAPLVN